MTAIKMKEKKTNNTEEKASFILSELQIILNEQTLSDIEKVKKVCSLIENYSNLEFAEIDDTAEKNWYQEQILNLDEQISFLQAELDGLIKQGSMLNETSIIKIQNDVRLKQLDLDKRILENKKESYSNKLKGI